MKYLHHKFSSPANSRAYVDNWARTFLPESERCVQCGGELEPCRCRPNCPGGHCVPCQGPQR